MPAEYDYTGNETAVNNLIRSYSTESVLKRINEISYANFYNDDCINAATSVEYHVFRKRSRIPIKKNALITAWDLIDLAYYAILYSNDYRGKKIDTLDEFCMLNASINQLRAKHEKHLLKDISKDTSKLMFFLWGFCGEQIKLQNQKHVFDNLGRDLYIIFEVAKKCGKDYKFDEVIKEETGVTWQQLISFLLLAWVGFSKANTLEEVLKWSGLENDNKDNFEKTIKYYTTTYEKVRDYGRQNLYAKPFIKTQKNEILGLGPNLILASYEHSIFWCIRNYYCNRKDSTFVNVFGVLFEKYLEELLDYYLNKNEYKRIPEADTPRADWELNLGGYCVIIEQKSSTMKISVKQQYTCIDDYVSYAKKSIVEAINQLDRTECLYKNKKCIKIIMVYDEYISPGILDTIFELPECTVENDHRYWLFSIGEMERMLYKYKYNQMDVLNLLKEKILGNFSNSVDIGNNNFFTDDVGSEDNPYLKREEIAYYRNYAVNNIIESSPIGEPVNG